MLRQLRLCRCLELSSTEKLHAMPLHSIHWRPACPFRQQLPLAHSAAKTLDPLHYKAQVSSTGAAVPLGSCRDNMHALSSKGMPLYFLQW